MTEPSKTEIKNIQDETPLDSAAVDSGNRLSGFQIWLSSRGDLFFRLGLISFVVAFVIFGTVLWITDNLNAENVGYSGLWIISFIAAGSIVLPLPGPVAVCIAATPDLGLNPLVIGLVSASAEALGEMTGYIAGISGRSLLKRNKYYPRVQSLILRRGGLFLLLGAIIPNPLFDVLGIAAGGVGYPIRKFLAIVFIAKAIKSVAIAYACLWGIDSIQGWLT